MLTPPTVLMLTFHFIVTSIHFLNRLCDWIRTWGMRRGQIYWKRRGSKKMSTHFLSLEAKKMNTRFLSLINA